VREVCAPAWSLRAFYNCGTDDTTCDVCDEGSKAESEEFSPSCEGMAFRLKCEEYFGGEEFGMNYRAEEEEEEKIKHRGLLCKETEGIPIKTVEELHIVGFNFWLSVSQ
jgi:hypothetical protein